MLRGIKDAFYFPVAGYFGLFAAIKLKRWKPRIVVVTGSNGKTTALHMLAARLGKRARYSHHRNSAFGICFDILDLPDAAHSRLAWPLLALLAPFKAWSAVPEEMLYVAECDADRPGEGDFLSALLRPETTVWLNCARTHSMRFERAARNGAFKNVDDAIAHEFGYFLECANKLVVVNGDDARIMREAQHSRARVETITEAADLVVWRVSTSGTMFDVDGKSYSFPFLLPKDVFRAIAASERVARYLGLASSDLSSFSMPPGRSSLLRGIKDTTIVDSSYNINVGSLAAILAMVEKLAGEKWLVLGDMTEQGAFEKEEHEKAARMLANSSFARVVLVGPRMRRFALPILQESGATVESFDGPKEALEYLGRHVQGNEILIFKGARFLEGIIERMLADKNDAGKLCRRGAHWDERRKAWGL